MAFDFNDLADMMASQAADQDNGDNNPEDLEEIQDQDVNDLEEQDEDHEEISDDEADKTATDTHDFENDEPDAIDLQLMSYLMGDTQASQGQFANTPSRQYGGGSLGNAGTVHSSTPSNNWLQSRVNNIKFSGFNHNRSKYAASLPQPSGQRNDETYEAIHNTAIQTIQNDPIAQRMGINIAKTGGAYSIGYKTGGAYSVGYQYGGRYTAPGMERKKQFGGDTLYAENEGTLRQGLNNDNYQRAVLNLKGNNTIRGLDNHQPVAVTDGKKYQVLKGPHDTAQFNGKVYEKRM